MQYKNNPFHKKIKKTTLIPEGSSFLSRIPKLVRGW